MSEILAGLIKIFSGGAGAAVSNIATFLGVVAALTPLAVFIVSDKSKEVLIEISYRDAAFWGAILAGMLLMAWLNRRQPS